MGIVARTAGAVGLAVGVLVSSSQPSAAADADGQYAVRGAGSQPCSAVLAIGGDMDGSIALLYRSWLEGYLTGLNRFLDDTFDASFILRSDSLLRLVLQVCRASPDLTVETALARLTNQLMPMRVASASPPVRVTVGESTTLLREETLRRVQERLRDEGLYEGDVDGGFDERVRDAVRRYQEREGLPATQLPDTATVMRLLLAGS